MRLRAINHAFFLLVFLWCGSAYANTCTWVTGSTKNWSDTTAWTLCGSVAPTAADDVVVAGTGTLTIDGTSGAPSLARSVNFTGFTGTVSQGASAQLNIGDGTTGAFTAVSGMTYAPSASSLIKFVSTTTGNNITTGTKRMGSVTFDGVGGAWTFQDAFNPVVASMVTLTNGTLNTNGQAVGASSGIYFSSSNSNTRALTLGASTITLPNAGLTVWDIATSTNMTLSAASSTITLGNSTTAGVFNGGGLTYGTVTATGVLTTGSVTINQSNTFGSITLTNGANVAGAFIFGGNQTVTGTWTGTGNSAINRLYYRSDVRGTPRTLSAGTWTLTNIDLQDTVGAGAGNKDLTGISGGAGNAGGNSGWTLSGGRNIYMKTAVSVNETAAGNWYTTSGGSTNISSPANPLVQDTFIFDANSITAGSITITQGLARIGAHNWTGVTNTPLWTKTIAASFFDSVTLVSGMTNGGTGAYTYEGRQSSDFTTAGLTWTNPITINAVNGVGTLVQIDNLTSSSTLTATSGTLDALTNSKTGAWTSITVNGGFYNLGGNSTGSSTLAVNTGGTLGLSTYTLTMSSSTTLQEGTISGTGTVATTGLTLSGTGVTMNAISCTISGSSGVTMNGSGSIYNMKTLTFLSGLNASAGLMNLYGTMSLAGAGVGAFVPVSSVTPLYSRIFGGF